MEIERIAKLEAQVDSIKEEVKIVKEDIKELHSRITTGNREIIEKISNMEHRLENKMNDGANAARLQHEEIQKEIKVDIKKVVQRVDVLERWRWMIVGGAIVLGYIIGHLELISNVLK